MTDCDSPIESFDEVSLFSLSPSRFSDWSRPAETQENFVCRSKLFKLLFCLEQHTPCLFVSLGQRCLCLPWLCQSLFTLPYSRLSVSLSVVLTGEIVTKSIIDCWSVSLTQSVSLSVVSEIDSRLEEKTVELSATQSRQ